MEQQTPTSVRERVIQVVEGALREVATHAEAPDEHWRRDAERVADAAIAACWQADAIIELQDQVAVLERELALIAREIRPQRDVGSRKRRQAERYALTRQEAADSMGMSVDHFEKRVQPLLRVIRCGQLVLVPPKELERWVQANALLITERQAAARRRPA